MTVFDFLKEEEGCRLRPYQDQHGIWTVGYGHNCQTTPISQTVADMMFKDDVAGAYRECERLAFWHRLDDVRQAALISMRFQLGMGGLLGFDKMLAALEREDYAAAAAEALDSDLARQTPERTTRIAHMLRTGRWANG